MHFSRSKLKEKFYETLKAVFPILAIVLVLCFTTAPIPPSILMAFLIGAVLLIVGMLLFNVGVDLSMTTMGERVGTIMTKSRKLLIIILISFIMGFIITISEPDLQVLAEQVPSIPNMTLILSVAAFDSGGVTTGPMTVPFIMALGIGFAAVRSDKHAEDDSFGLVSLCSIGPILAVLLLGLLYHPEDTGYVPAPLPDIQDSIELWQHFAGNFPAYIKEIAVSLFPIVAFFGAFQIVSLKLKKKTLYKILIGIADTYIGLVLFLTGANVGFMPAGNHLGQMIADLPFRFILIPIGMMIGFFIVKAEPAVYVLMDQVEEITSGAIPGKAMGLSMSLGVAASVGIAMIRVLTGVSILWFIVPGYIIAICLSFFVPKIFTAIAFDSGGVASGPMTAAFLLPFAMGACQAVGGNIVRDAFGIVAMVAMTPLIAIQILGAVYQYKSRIAEAMEAAGAAYLDTWGDDDIIEL